VLFKGYMNFEVPECVDNDKCKKEAKVVKFYVGYTNRGLISNSAHFQFCSFLIRQIAQLFCLITWAGDELQSSL
jgi:hypothetical protein